MYKPEVNSRNSFDVLRYFFAFSLVLVHFCTLTQTEQFWFISGGTRVKAFFIITGFLVLYSGQHSSLKDYTLKRVSRIMPAYITCILLCFILGAIYTELDIRDFLSNSLSWKYLVSNLLFLNFLSPNLPGVFQDNPMTAMNGSLWSMKVEVAFYIILPAFIWLLKKCNKHAVILVTYLISTGYTVFCGFLYDKTDNQLYYLLQHQFIGQMTFFLGGSIMLLYFEQLNKYYKILFPIAMVAYLYSKHSMALTYLEPITFAIVLITIAYHFPVLTFLYGKPNISYGIYLYHFPIIQVLWYYGIPQQNLLFSFIITLVLTVFAASLSWIFIEKPVLDLLKRRLKRSRQN